MLQRPSPSADINHNVVDAMGLETDFTFKSGKLKYDAPYLYYSLNPDKPIDLSRYYIPVSNVSPRLKSLDSYKKHVRTALALADGVILRSRDKKPTRDSIHKTITRYWCTVLYFREEGKYWLSKITPKDIHKLFYKFSHGSWPLVLNTNQKVFNIIKSLNENNFRFAIRYYCRPEDKVIDTLNRDFWLKRLGFIPSRLFNLSNKNEFIQKATKLGYTFVDRWKNCFVEESYSKAPFARIVHYICFLNTLLVLPKGTNKLNFLAFEQPIYNARKLCVRAEGRTDNLGIEEATYIIGKSLDWLYDYGPKLVSILEEIRNIYPTLSKSKKETYLYDNSPFDKLAKELGVRIANTWSAGRNPAYPAEHYSFVEKLIGALFGACAIIIASLNARRVSEVCDHQIGLRIKDFLPSNDDIHQVNFYVEKSIKGRHLFYVNQTTADAIAILIRLKKSCYPINENEQLLGENESLFTCHRWTSRVGPKNLVKFKFANFKKQSRSISSFMSFLDEKYQRFPLKSHMWRRYFSILYIYQYDNSSLQSLSQHLRHFSIQQSLIYISDPDARALHERIANKIPQTKKQRIIDRKTLYSLLDENDELAAMIEEVSKEKFFETVNSILNAKNIAGGFPSLVRRLYRIFSKSVSFRKTTDLERSQIITNALEKKDYSAKPMRHGQCNAPSHNFVNNAKCSEKGIIKRKNASASLCAGCAYHSTNNSFMENLRKDLKTIESDINNPNLPRFIRQELKEESKETKAVIARNIQNAAKNSKNMKKTRADVDD